MVFRIAHSTLARSESETRAPTSAERRARYANALLGLWLFLSAFVWPQEESARINTCLVGLFIGVCAVTATGWGFVRHVTMILALWLAFSTVLVYPGSGVALYNNLLVSVLVLALAEIPLEGRRTHRIDH
jgi:hypothetical protein